MLPAEAGLVLFLIKARLLEVGAWTHVLALELPQLSMSGDSIQ